MQFLSHLKMRAVILLSFLAFVSASDVIELSDSDFQSGVGGRDIILIEFFAPWCGHCKKLAPEYEKAATALLSADPPVPLAKVDCTASTETCGKYGVSGYPTLKIFRNGELAEDYNGPREADGIIKYMKSKSGPSSKNLQSVAAAEKFLSSTEAAIVGFFDSEEHELAKNLKKVADSMSEDYRFAYSVSEEVNKKYGYENKIVIFYPAAMHSKFEDKQVVFDGKTEMQALKHFITSKVFGICGHRTSGNSAKFEGRPLIVAYYDVDYVKNPKGTNYWRNRVMKVGKKFLDDGKKLSLAVSSASEFAGELGEFGVSFSDKPVVTAKDGKEQKFVMTEEFSMENLEAFISDILAGKLEPYLKSEPVPDNSGSAVKVAVAKNFDELVNDPERDVLIEFYAPWCGHCKNLEPKYKELAETLSGETSVTIAKMDATANDVPAAYNVRGFPTIYYAPKNSKSNPRKYEGGREVDDFMKYLAKESTDGLQGFDRNGKPKKTDL